MAEDPRQPLNPGFEKGRGGYPKTAGALVRPIAREVIQRVADGARNLWGQIVGTAESPPLTAAGGIPAGPPNPPMGMGQTLIPPPGVTFNWRDTEARREPWFGPGQPIAPVAPRADVAGRAWDYQPNRNIGTQRRPQERASFEQLRTIADSFDLVRLAIETRKDQMAKLEFSVLPRQRSKDELRAKPTAACARIEEALRRPDRRNAWDTWLRLLLEDCFVTDAATIYVRRTRAGDVYALEPVDGTTIVPLLDMTGRQPMAPDPAFLQVLRGMPAIHYTGDELLYLPRNPRLGRVYGMSPVEQITMTVNVAVRREVAKLQYFTEGNIPEALCSVPEDWTPSQISEFQAMWDALMSDQSSRRKMKFVPGGMNVQYTRESGTLMEAYDEWLARVICYAFSLPALPFIKMQNRATAESAYESAIEEGLQPMMLWVKGFMDRIVQTVYGEPELEFVWDDIEKIAKADRDRTNMAFMQAGVKSLDEVRADIGLGPLGMEPAIFGGGPNGVIFISDLVEAKRAGLTKIQPPMQGYGGMGGMGGMMGDPSFVDGAPGQMLPPGQSGMEQGQPLPPGQGGAKGPGVDDILAGVNPRLLAAVGLGPGGREEREVDVTEGEAQGSDPLAQHAAHPQVLNTLRAFERANRRR